MLAENRRETCCINYSQYEFGRWLPHVAFPNANKWTHSTWRAAFTVNQNCWKWMNASLNVCSWNMQYVRLYLHNYNTDLEFKLSHIAFSQPRVAKIHKKGSWWVTIFTCIWRFEPWLWHIELVQRCQEQSVHDNQGNFAILNHHKVISNPPYQITLFRWEKIITVDIQMS